MYKTHTARAVGAALLSSVLVSAPSLAETSKDQKSSESEIERLVVVSSRIEMPIKQLATSVSVLDEQDLLTRGYVNLADALRITPAISVARSGSPGSPTTLRIRGEEGFRTMVRIDGVNIADPTGVQFLPQLEHLQTANTGRVEILRGTQGLVYGADAGGIINITSRQYEAPLAGRIFAETGRYGTQNFAADVGGQTEQFEGYFAAQQFDTDGFNARVDDASADADGYENQTFHTRLGYTINDALSVSLVARNTSGDGQFDNCFDSSFSRSDDCSSDFEQTNVRTQLNYQGESVAHTLAFAKTTVERELLTEQVSTFFTKGTIERAEYLGSAQIGENNRAVFGADWQQDAITQGDVSSRTNVGVFAEYQGQFQDNLYYTLGARYDDNQDFGQHLSYRLSAARLWQQQNYDIKLRTSYGTGFRAPSLFEVAYNQGPIAFAPAADVVLQEEQSAGIDVGLGAFSDTFTYEIVYFNQRIENAILFDLAVFSGYLQEQGLSRSEGVELIIKHEVTAGLSINANYVYNDAKDNNDSQRIGRPRHLANLGMQYANDIFQIAFNVRAVRDVVDIVGALDDYELADITAQYFISPKLTLHGRLENAFDTDYVEVGGFNTPGASLHMGVSYTF